MPRRIYVALYLLLLASCVNKEREQQVTYKPYHVLYEEPADDRLKKLKADFLSNTTTPDSVPVKFDSLWFFTQGSSSEKLICNAQVQREGQHVTLPHRSEKPNTSLWYSREMEIKQKGVLRIHADDGAQVFLNGKQIRRRDGVCFPIDTVGRFMLTVRVLNNAMSGGLKQVSFFATAQFARYIESNVNMVRRKKILEKVLLLKVSSPDVISLATHAFKNPDDATLRKAEESVASFPFLTGPWIQQVGSAQWSINVMNDSDLTILLEYGELPNKLDAKVKKKGPFVSFLLNLQANRKYYYRIVSGETTSPVYAFHTDVLPTSFSFAVWADSQSGWETFQKNIVNTMRHDDAFSIGVGDLVSEGSDEEEWRMFFNTLGESSASIPYYLMAGNHDYDGYYDNLEPALYKKYLQRRSSYFSWTKGNCAFIALDPNQNFPIGIEPGSKQYIWFHEQLNSIAWKQATWRFVLLHQPPYSQGWAGYEGDDAIRKLLEPLMESAKIDFVVSGHTHDYERLTKMYGKQRTTFVIVGGAGGSLEPLESSPFPKMDTVIKTHHMGRFKVNGNEIEFQAIDVDDNVIDSFMQVK